MSDSTRVVELRQRPLDGIEDVRYGLEEHIPQARAVVVGIAMRDGTYRLTAAGDHPHSLAAASYLVSWLTED